MSNLVHPQRMLAEVQKGYYELLRLFSEGKKLTPQAKKELQLTFKRLRGRLARIAGKPPAI